MDDIKDENNENYDENELLKMLNAERDINGLYHMAIRNISDILIEFSDYYDKVRKIRQELNLLTYEFGKQSGNKEIDNGISLN